MHSGEVSVFVIRCLLKSKPTSTSSSCSILPRKQQQMNLNCRTLKILWGGYPNSYSLLKLNKKESLIRKLQINLIIVDLIYTFVFMKTVHARK